MSSRVNQRTAARFHLGHLLLFAFSAPLYLGGLLSDMAYASSYEIQWLNFAAWLVAGAMVFTGLALAWSIFEAIFGARGRAALVGLVLLLATFAAGLLGSLAHARDAWAAMPDGLILSIIVTSLSIASIWISLHGLPPRGAQ